MNSSPRKRWTKAEKWLFFTPVLVGIGAAIMTIAPEIARKKLGRPIELPTSAKDSLSGIALSRDGRILVASEQLATSKNKSVNTIYVWDALTLKTLLPVTRPILHNGKMTDSQTMCVSASPDGNRIAYGTWSGTSAVFDRSTQKILWTKPGMVHDLVFSPNGKWIGLNYNDFPVRSTYQVLDAATGYLIKEWVNGPEEGGTALAFSTDSQLIASVGKRPKWDIWFKHPNDFGEIELRRTDNWKLMRTFHLPNTQSIAFAPNGKSLLATANLYPIPFQGGGDGALVRCFDTNGGRVIWEKNTHEQKALDWAPIVGTCFSPDGAIVAILDAGIRGKVILLNASTGKIQRTLTIPSPAQNYKSFSLVPQAIVFSPDGKRLFVRDNHAVLVWDLD